MSPAELVQRQLDAYNAHDLDAFLETYSENAKVIRMPSATPMVSGKAEISHLYSTKIFNVPNHRAELLGRLAAGDKVIDHERVFGLSEKPFEAVAVYEVTNELIQCVWLFAAR